MTEREKIANENLRKIAKFTKENLPEGMGFVVLAFEFGMNAEGNRMLYVSNASREDVVDAMDEFKEKVQKDNFGKHDKAEGKTWYDIDELLGRNFGDETTIWCLNRLNYSDFLTTMGDIRKAVEQTNIDELKHYQFTVVGKGEKHAK